MELLTRSIQYQYGYKKNIFTPPLLVISLDTIEKRKLVKEAEAILQEPNAGGKSIRSEAYAMHLLSLLYKAETVRTEMKIKYFNEWWKKCDFITRIGTTSYGISVTRAVFGSYNHRYLPDEIDIKVANLLQKKLSGLVIARAGITINKDIGSGSGNGSGSDSNGFTQAILFIWSPNRLTTSLLYYTFHFLTDETLRGDVSLVIAELTENSSEAEMQSDFPSNLPTKVNIYSSFIP